MTDLLLTHGYFLWEDEKEREIMKPYAPLGLLYISAYLKRAGFDVETFDTTFSDRESLVARLAATPGGVVGVYTNLMTRANAIWIAEQAHLHRWTVIFGGPESANYPDDYIERGADVVVLGEGENTLEELLPALRDRGPHRLHGVAGTVFRDEDGAVVHNDPRDKVHDIDSLPWPDREAIDMQQYVDTWRTHHGMGSVNLITARGCPYKCNWCSHAVFGYSHRRRDPIDCVDEVQHIVERYQPEQVWYADDVFTISHKWLFEYRDEMNRRNMRIPFETISRADRMKKEEVLAALAELGCYRIWIGVRERQPADPRRDAARREGRRGAERDEDGQEVRHRGRHVPDVGLRGGGALRHRSHHRSRQGVEPRHLLHHRRLSDQEHRVTTRR